MLILVVGYNAFDVTVPLPGLPALDSKQEVAAILHGGGGPGATAAVALARLGAEVRLATVFGDDVGALVQRQELTDAGVDLGPSVTARGHRSPQAVILVDAESETRTVLWTRGELPPLEIAAVELSWLDNCDLLYCDGHEAKAAAALARQARLRDLPVVLDAGSVRAGTAELVECATDVIGSSGFATTLTGEPDAVSALRALRARGPERVATTFGEAGILALDGDEIRHVPAFAVEVRDTTGAGDAFHAGYAYARAEGRSWTAALEFGAAVAALKCRGWGGRPALPVADEVEKLMRGGRRRPNRPPCTW